MISRKQVEKRILNNLINENNLENDRIMFVWFLRNQVVYKKGKYVRIYSSK